MKKKYFLIATVLVFTYAKSQQSISLSNQKQVNFKFMDSETGFALRPDAFTIIDVKDENNYKKISEEQISADGTFSISLDLNKTYKLSAELNNYKSMSTQITVENSSVGIFQFHLSPLKATFETNPEHVKSLHKKNATVILGFIVDEKTGKPLTGASVSINKSNEAFSGEKGYYFIYVPVEKGIDAETMYIKKPR